MKAKIFEITPDGVKASKKVLPIYIDKREECTEVYSLSVNFNNEKLITTLGYNGHDVFKVQVFKIGYASGSHSKFCKEIQDNYIIPVLLENNYIREITDLSKILDAYQAAKEKNELPLQITKEDALTLFLNADSFTKESDDEITEYTLFNLSHYVSENQNIKFIFYESTNSFEII